MGDVFVDGAAVYPEAPATSDFFLPACQCTSTSTMSITAKVLLVIYASRLGGREDG